VTAIHDGAVNDEIEITLAGGDRLVAVITRTKSLGLAAGKPVCSPASKLHV